MKTTLSALFLTVLAGLEACAQSPIYGVNPPPYTPMNSQNHYVNSTPEASPPPTAIPQYNQSGITLGADGNAWYGGSPSCYGGPTGNYPSVPVMSYGGGVDYTGACGPGAGGLAPYRLPYADANAMACGGAPAGPRWFGAAYGLMMTRSADKDLFVGYDTAMPRTHLLTTEDASMSYAGGVEAHIGRIIDDSWAIEGVYWGIYPSDQVAQIYATDMTGAIGSPFDFTWLDYDNGTGPMPVGNYFDNSQVLRVLRTFSYHNVEVNFLRAPLCWTAPGCRQARLGLLSGVRYMQIEEGLDIDADAVNNAFGDDIANELFYDIQVRNSLVGYQIGGQFDYCLTNRLSLQIGSKLGVFGNQMKHRQTVWGGNGSAIISATSPLGYGGSAYSVNSTASDVAFLGELQAGLSVCLTKHWSLTGGYRAVALSGIATPANQIAYRFDDLQSARNIHSNGSMVLHGAYAGLECMY